MTPGVAWLLTRFGVCAFTAIAAFYFATRLRRRGETK